jgi:hypothetical protein
MEATLGISVQLSLSQTSKNAVFLIISYVFSTKSEKRAEQVLPGSKGWEGWKMGGEGTNNVYTCKYM